MIREAQKRGHQVSACEVPHIQWQRGECVKAQVQDLRLTGDANAWYDYEIKQIVICYELIDMDYENYIYCEGLGFSLKESRS